jgi:hypothetical protein
MAKKYAKDPQLIETLIENAQGLLDQKTQTYSVWSDEEGVVCRVSILC